MAGLSFDSRSSSSAFLSAGIFPADSTADLVFSMRSSVIYKLHRFPPPRGFAFRSRELGDPEIACRDVTPSAAGFRLRYVTLNLFGVGSDNGANEKAAAIVNINLWNRVDVVLLRHRRVPIDDVDL